MLIRSMTCVSTQETADRSRFDPMQLATFEKVTGILHTRRWRGTATELAILAADRHKRDHGIEGIEAVIVVTQSQDRNSPCMAVEIQAALGLPTNLMCFDVNQSCDGFIYGLDIATTLRQRSLVVFVDMLRAKEELIDSLIFSDAAVAVTVEGGFPDLAYYYSDGTGSRQLCADDDGRLCMNGGAVFDFVTQQVPKFLRSVVIPGSDDFICLHQANESMMRIVAKRAGYSPEQCVEAINVFGNMSMCSIPFALAYNEEKILGKSVTMCGYGAGWSAAIMNILWPRQRVTSIETVAM